ncbi:MAG TPA: FHA domain-containing protein [Dehalococcoidia bacterium]|nr:FHA domain-containing protein [Dehalococcoidia bacterium]
MEPRCGTRARTLWNKCSLIMAMEPRASLIAKGGPEDGTVTSLGLEVLSFDRSMMSNIVVDQPGISRQHASIRGDASGFWIADAGSRNDTYLKRQETRDRTRDFERGRQDRVGWHGGVLGICTLLNDVGHSNCGHDCDHNVHRHCGIDCAHGSSGRFSGPFSVANP